MVLARGSCTLVFPRWAGEPGSALPSVPKLETSPSRLDGASSKGRGVGKRPASTPSRCTSQSNGPVNIVGPPDSTESASRDGRAAPTCLRKSRRHREVPLDPPRNMPGVPETPYHSSGQLLVTGTQTCRTAAQRLLTRPSTSPATVGVLQGAGTSGTSSPSLDCRGERQRGSSEHSPQSPPMARARRHRQGGRHAGCTLGLGWLPIRAGLAGDE